MSKTWRFCSSFKNVCLQAWDTWKISAKMHFWQARDNRCSSEMLGGQGADFVRGVAFWSIRSSSLVKSFSVWPGILFRGRRNTLDRWSGKITKRIGTRPLALHSTVYFWKKSRRTDSFLTLSTSNMRGSLADLAELFRFDVKLVKSGSPAECLRFWHCQLRAVRGPRRLALVSN